MESARIKTILLVDDDSIANLISTRVIEMSSTFKVVGATHAQDALDLLGQWSTSPENLFPDVIFLDVNMPVMDGWEFLNEFQKLPTSVLEKCKVFMLSSSIDPSDVEKSKMYRCVYDFISKPLTPEKFEALTVEIILKCQKCG